MQQFSGPALQHAPPQSAMAGNLVSTLPWGPTPPGVVPVAPEGNSGNLLLGAVGSTSKRRSDPKAKIKCRKSASELFNSRATHFCALTPWNKIEILNEIAPESFGMLYMSDATLDQLDAAILIGTGMTPHDRVLFKDKSTQWQAGCGGKPEKQRLGAISVGVLCLMFVSSGCKYLWLGFCFFLRGAAWP